MINRRFLIALVLLLSSLQLSAQQPENENTSDAPGSTAAPATDEPSEAPATVPATDAAASSTESADSPFDYRASEQISEDLPVSFRVDI